MAGIARSSRFRQPHGQSAPYGGLPTACLFVRPSGLSLFGRPYRHGWPAARVLRSLHSMLFLARFRSSSLWGGSSLLSPAPSLPYPCISLKSSGLRDECNSGCRRCSSNLDQPSLTHTLFHCVKTGSLVTPLFLLHH